MFTTGKQFVAGAEVWIGPEGTNDKETCWELITAGVITPGTTPIKFMRSYQEDRWVKRLASAGTGWHTTSSTTLTPSAGTLTATVGASLLTMAGDVVFFDDSVGRTITGTVFSYSGTTLVFVGSAFTGSGSNSSWTVDVTQVQGYYPGTVYFQDFSADVPCWLTDVQSTPIVTGLFFRAGRGFNAIADGVTRGVYSTQVATSGGGGGAN